MIPVRFNPANYSVKEGVDGNAVISLEVQGDHPDFDFTLTVTTQDGTAIGESGCHPYTLLHSTRAYRFSGANGPSRSVKHPAISAIVQ